jgi:hypothetical protein
MNRLDKEYLKSKKRLTHEAEKEKYRKDVLVATFVVCSSATFFIGCNLQSCLLDVSGSRIKENHEE